MHEYKATMLRIVDGDTVDVDIDLGFGVWLRKQRIRLFGIDTPESRTRDLQEKYYGNLAKNYIKDRLPVGSVFNLKTEKDDRGKFGRILGILMYSSGDGEFDLDLNEEMIMNAYGVKYHGQSKDDIEQQHLDNRKILAETGITYDITLDK
jgi:micrococcal nuclease|tara:strand:+ start:957 stop:1406 length:450 start_codon:yes stop_codon:yes gene_type:complete